jgi:bacterioferritin
MASKKLKDLLNQAIAREIQVSVQYMWQHVQWKGMKAFAVKDTLKSFAIAEMKHAEAIAERLVTLGGTPTTKPEPIFVGAKLADMLKQDQTDEAGAIKLYTQIIDVADDEGDIITEDLFKKILADEQDHFDTFSGLLEKD